jgi:hypothetical protein
MRLFNRYRTLRGDSRLLYAALCFFLFAALLAGSRAARADEVREITIDAVERLDVRGAIELELSQGEPRLLVRGDSEDLDKTPWALSGRGLVLGYSRSDRRASFDGLKFILSLPALESLRVAGSGRVYMREFKAEALSVSIDGSGDARLHGVSGERLSLRVAGSGDIHLVTARVDTLETVIAGSGDIVIGDLTASLLDAVVQGSGDLRVNSSASPLALDLSIVGSGDVDLGNIDLTHAEINVVGSGDADLGHIAESLDVTILGSGNIRYEGDPEKDSITLGSGSVKQRKAGASR